MLEDQESNFLESKDEEVILFSEGEKPKSRPVSAQLASSPASDEEEASKFQIKVASPEKVGEGLMNTHVEYKIDVKTSLQQYKQSEFSVLRRYSDFDWLREQLSEAYKGYLIPPLPEKAILNRFNVEFMEYRRRELEKFLQRIAVHPVLHSSQQLQTFFEAGTVEGTTSLKQAVKKDNKEKQTESGGGTRLFSFLGSSIETISHINFSSLPDPDQWFDAKKNYINALETQLNAVLKSSNATIKKRRELGASISEFGISCSLLASVDADHDQSTSNSFNKLADIVSQITLLDEKRADDETAFFEDAIRDYIRILSAVKEMLTARNEKLVAYQTAAKQLETKKEKLDKTKGSAKLEAETKAAEDKLTETEEEFNKISNIAKGELQRFEATKLRDIRAILIKLTQTNLNYELQVADQWRILLSDIQLNKN